ncbi:MAG TPA: hypothetical protein VEL07_09255 [Planctomycetota bacterium]|nr:hypothetical protein [Planctomycetota bacterium]
MVAPRREPTPLLPAYERYFGAAPGGVDLAQSLVELPVDAIERWLYAVEAMPARGRIVFFGNGGSFDNARLLAQRCRAHGLRAKTPGEADDYFATAMSEGYGRIFAKGLEQDDVGVGDIVVGISGSGNSENVVAALTLARARGADAFCLGGRDGGRMRGVCGDERSLIGRNQCMEAIEDLHAAMILIALDARRRGVSVAQAAATFRERFAAFMAGDNLAALAALGGGMLRALGERGHVFVLGTGIGANHFRADMGRGASNTLPIRGLSTPECFTLNSAQATANDDGMDFVIADGLAKFEPGARDCAILCDLPGAERMLAHCATLLDAGRVERHAVGARGVRLDAFADHDAEFAVAMLGHACGEVLRGWLTTRWAARALDLTPAFPAGQKKLGVAETEALERELRRAGTMQARELLTFCYGRCYAVTPPADHDGARSFF